VLLLLLLMILILMKLTCTLIALLYTSIPVIERYKSRINHLNINYDLTFSS